MPGYEGLILRSADFPDGHFLGWTPGQITPVVEMSSPGRLQEGSDLVVQLHLRPDRARRRGRADHWVLLHRSAAGAAPGDAATGPADAGDSRGSAPATESRTASCCRWTSTLRVVQPHAHFRARQSRRVGASPDGTREPLLRIGDWDARWQDRYRYRAPLRLPAGTRIWSPPMCSTTRRPIRAIPVQPPALAEWGWRTSDEMGDVWFQMMSVDRRRSGAAEPRTQAEDAGRGRDRIRSAAAPRAGSRRRSATTRR